MATERSQKKFRWTILHYYERRGRSFPWRPPSLKLRSDGTARDPYRILVSEIMLQQTQVERVEGKYKLFLKRFPDFKPLATASTREVLTKWQGLGYNRRALALKRIAEIVVKKYRGVLPRDAALLVELPGIGKATAGAISAFAFNKPTPFIETNIRRVFIKFFFPQKREVNDEEIMKLVEKTIDRNNPREWYYALMDYGNALGRNLPALLDLNRVKGSLSNGSKGANPNRKSAHYRKQAPFHGSKREVRGKILRMLSVKNAIAAEDVAEAMPASRAKIIEALHDLAREGFVRIRGKRITIRP